jgi:hypothetical protein
MSGYSAGEALILTALRAAGAGSTWVSNNSSRGNWSMLGSGLSNHYAILKPGPGRNEFIGMSEAERTFSTIVEVWVSYQADGTSLTDLEGYADAILSKFDAANRLGDTGGTIEDAMVISWSEVEERWARDESAPRWLKQNFTIEWKEQSDVTFTG